MRHANAPTAAIGTVGDHRCCGHPAQGPCRHPDDGRLRSTSTPPTPAAPPRLAIAKGSLEFPGVFEERSFPSTDSRTQQRWKLDNGNAQLQMSKLGFASRWRWSNRPALSSVASPRSPRRRSSRAVSANKLSVKPQDRRPCWEFRESLRASGHEVPAPAGDHHFFTPPVPDTVTAACWRGYRNGSG